MAGACDKLAQRNKLAISRRRTLRLFVALRHWFQRQTLSEIVSGKFVRPEWWALPIGIAPDLAGGYVIEKVKELAALQLHALPNPEAFPDQ
jgi:hypothetical protein